MAELINIPPNINPNINAIKPESKETNKSIGFNKTEDFRNILQQKIGQRGLKISNHAQMRMNMRNISLDDAQMAKLSDAVDRAEQKGVRESLILMNDLAFVVSVKNRTVITAVDGPSIKENVFTNIDGAVII
ncbi:MAG: flagellar protein [Tepidanaerobacteraceae bacterium]|jgi:flagellar operon protein|nr:flagellar protein [Tepidanaerobacteraceae bacterium]